MLESVNVIQPRCHREADWTLLPQVVTYKLDKILGQIPDLLIRCDYVDPLVQNFARFFLLQAILSHHQ